MNLLRTRSTLTERLLAVGILKGEETPRRGTPVLAYRVPMDKAGLLVEGGGGARVIADQLLILGF